MAAGAIPAIDDSTPRKVSSEWIATSTPGSLVWISRLVSPLSNRRAASSPSNLAPPPIRPETASNTSRRLGLQIWVGLMSCTSSSHPSALGVKLTLPIGQPSTVPCSAERPENTISTSSPLSATGLPSIVSATPTYLAPMRQESLSAGVSATVAVVVVSWPGAGPELGASLTSSGSEHAEMRTSTKRAHVAANFRMLRW